jgi:hypothetical protein
MDAYGGRRCACCGETEFLFLSIDHIHGGGNRDRKEKKVSGGLTFYRWLKRAGWPPGFQILCMNCQFGRKHNGGVCPHQLRAANAANA